MKETCFASFRSFSFTYLLCVLFRFFRLFFRTFSSLSYISLMADDENAESTPQSSLSWRQKPKDFVFSASTSFLDFQNSSKKMRKGPMISWLLQFHSADGLADTYSGANRNEIIEALQNESSWQIPKNQVSHPTSSFLPSSTAQHSRATTVSNSNSFVASYSSSSSSFSSAFSSDHLPNSPLTVSPSLLSKTAIPSTILSSSTLSSSISFSSSSSSLSTYSSPSFLFSIFS